VVVKSMFGSIIEWFYTKIELNIQVNNK